LPNDHISSIVEPMLTKFYKYWEEVKVFAAVVDIFDPRSKMSYVKFKLRDKAKSQEVAAVEIENVLTALYSWYKQYITDSESKKQNQKSKNIDQQNDIICTSEVEDDNTQAFRQHLARTKGIGSTSAAHQLVSLIFTFKSTTLKFLQNQILTCLNGGKSTHFDSPPLAKWPEPP
jgi:hypothetical protein